MKRLQVFTRLPGEADPERVREPHLGEHELPLEPEAVRDRALALVMRKTQFERDPNPVYALEAFVLAVQLGLYPPEWSVRFLAERFAKWHIGGGHEELDKVLGLRSRGRGRRAPAMHKAQRAARDSMLVLELGRLVALGASVAAAAAAVEARLASETWDQSGWKLGNIGADRVKRIYERHGVERMRALGAAAVKDWTEEQRAEYLALFPPHARPQLRVTKKAISRSSSR